MNRQMHVACTPVAQAGARVATADAPVASAGARTAMAVSALLAVVFALPAVALAAETVPLVAVYGQQWRHCTGLAEAQDTADRARHRNLIGDCFADAFQRALAEPGARAGEHLHAALAIAPERAEQLFALALDAGMHAGDALAVASRAAPRKRGKLVEVAIASGADPTLLLTATAAGSR